eukprot:GILJ01012185.1.p1 GENE.GILJ01012185.1~~GILJ01012185.1.p1  ORF type:complete len:267 (-),score=22.26 GILJ01012185.1:205-1005(-)
MGDIEGAANITVSIILAIAILVSSPIFLFFSNRHVRFIVTLSGFAIGAYLGFLTTAKSGYTNVGPLFLALVCGGVTAFVSLVFKFIGVGAMGFLAGGVLTNFIYQLAVSSSSNNDSIIFVMQIVASIGVGLLVAAFLLKYQKVLFLPLACMLGGFFAAAAIAYFSERFGWVEDAALSPEHFISDARERLFVFSSTGCWPFVMVWGLLSTVGLLVQLVEIRRRPSRRKPAKLQLPMTVRRPVRERATSKWVKHIPLNEERKAQQIVS